MALTKVSGGILDPGINVAGIVTATGFDGPFTGGSGSNINAGIITATGLDLNGNGDISGDLVIGGNLTANGDFTTLNTTLREVEILRVDANTTAVAGIITQRGSGDILNLFDNNTEILTVKDGGSVGINSTSPREKLDVIGNANVIVTNNKGIKLGYRGENKTAYIGLDANDAANAGTQSWANSAYIGFYSDGSSERSIKYRANVGSHIFQGTNGDEYVRITSVGNLNVGIGLTLADNKPASFGNSNDLQIIHQSGENHFLLNSGNTFFKGDVSWGVRTSSNQNILQTNSVYRTVDLYGSGSKILSTSGIGVTIRQGLYIENAEFNMTTNGSKILDFETGGSNGVYFRHNPSDSGNTTFLKATHGGALELYHDGDGAVKLTTQSTGVFITGALRLQGTESSYITGQAQPLIYRTASTSGSYPFNAYGHLVIQTRTDSQNRDIIFATGTSSANQIIINSSGHLVPGTAGTYNLGSTTARWADIYISDDKSVQIGNSQDLKIFHDSTANNNVIEGHTGSLNLRNYNVNSTNIVLSARNNIILQTNLNETAIQCIVNGATEIFHDGGATPKLRTTTTGIQVLGEVAATQDYPNFRPKIDLNFVANSRMDPRISYSRTGPASFINSKGLVEYVGPDAPRIDHDPDTGECKGLLIEESRTNIAPYSHDLSQFSGHNITKTANNAVAPDGTTTATKLEHGGSGTSYLDYIDNNINAQNAGPYTYSVWLKAPDDQPDGYYGCRIAVLHSTGGNVEPTVSLNKTWTRYSVTKTFGASDGGKLRVHPVMFRAAPGSTYDGKVIPSYVWAWGAQIEAGAYSTSYIPPNSVAPYQISGSGVTRGTEYAFIEGQDFADTYNDHEGTFLLQATTETLDNSNHGGWGAEKGSNRSGHTFNLGYRVGGGGSGYTGAWYTANGSTSAFFNMNAGVTAGTPFKIAFSYKVNDMNASTNGSTESADTSAAIDPDFDRFTLGNYHYGAMRKGYIQRAVYYTSKLTDSQLKTLTS